MSSASSRRPDCVKAGVDGLRRVNISGALL